MYGNGSKPVDLPVAALRVEADVHGDRGDVDDGPERRQPEEHEDERPAPVELRDLVGQALAPREVLLELLVRVRRRALGEHRVRLAKALAHLGQDGHGRLGRAAQVLAELLARQLEEHRVDHGANAGAARLVVEERELAEVLARANVLEHDGRRVLVRARQVDLHRAGLHDVHRRADVPLREDDVARPERLLGQPRRERLAVLVGQALKEGDLRQEVGGAHRVNGRAELPRWARARAGPPSHTAIPHPRWRPPGSPVRQGCRGPRGRPQPHEDGRASSLREGPGERPGLLP